MNINGNIEIITIESIMKLFPEFILVSGNKGINKEVRVVNIIDSPEITNYIQGGELFLTNAYIYRNNIKKLTKLVSEIANKNSSGLGIVVKQFIDEIPPDTIRISNELNLPILIIPIDIPFVEIISKIMTRIINKQNLELKRANEIREQLTNIVLNKGSIEETLLELYKITNVFPFFVTIDFSKTYYPVKKPSVFITSKINKLVMELPSAHSQDISAYIDNNFIDDFTLTPTEIAGETVGYLFGVLDNAPMSSINLTAFRYATVNISISLLKEQAINEHEENTRRDYFLDIILGVNQPKELIRERSKMLNLDESKKYYVINVEIHKNTGTTTRNVNKIFIVKNIGNSIHNLLSYTFSNTTHIIRENNVIFIVNTESPMTEFDFASSLSEIEKKVNEEFSVRYPGYKLFAGVSTENDVFNLNRSYTEALFATRIGKQINSTKSLFLYKDIGIYRHLFQMKMDDFSENIFDNTVRKLILHDLKNNSKLFNTLDCYLQNLSIDESAKRLFIHPNTLRYRLKKIEKLTEKKINILHDRILLEVCIQLFKTGKIT